MGMITSSNFKNSFVFCKSTEDEFIKRKWSEEFSIFNTQLTKLPAKSSWNVGANCILQWIKHARTFQERQLFKIFEKRKKNS